MRVGSRSRFNTSGSDEVNTMTDQANSPNAIDTQPTEFTVEGRHGVPVTFRGVLLASASSHQDEHRHRGDYAPKRWPCGACRWFEVALYRVVDDQQPHERVYMVHTRGMTIVDDEIIYARAAWAETPYEILQLLTQWKTNSDGPMLPSVSLDALYEASDADPTIKVALNEWLRAGA